MARFPHEAARAAVRTALAEDIGAGDLTAEAVIPHDVEACAVILAKESGVIAGLPLVAIVFEELDWRIRTELLAREGDFCQPGVRVVLVEGPARPILSGERVALNFLQRLSGIATLTHQFVEVLKAKTTAGRPIPFVRDTRKTTPGLRALEKYAVTVGGGQNHRRGLFDQILIKENHLRILGSLGVEPVAIAVRAARLAHPGAPVEIEAQSIDEASKAADAIQKAGGGMDQFTILLDNLSAAEVREAVAVIGGRAHIEASGGITLANIAEIAASGVDYISVGALTHSAPALDFSLEVEK